MKKSPAYQFYSCPKGAVSLPDFFIPNMIHHNWVESVQRQNRISILLFEQRNTHGTGIAARIDKDLG